MLASCAWAYLHFGLNARAIGIDLLSIGARLFERGFAHPHAALRGLERVAGHDLILAEQLGLAKEAPRLGQIGLRPRNGGFGARVLGVHLHPLRLRPGELCLVVRALQPCEHVTFPDDRSLFHAQRRESALDLRRDHRFAPRDQVAGSRQDRRAGGRGRGAGPLHARRLHRVHIDRAEPAAGQVKRATEHREHQHARDEPSPAAARLRLRRIEPQRFQFALQFARHRFLGSRVVKVLSLSLGRDAEPLTALPPELKDVNLLLKGPRPRRAPVLIGRTTCGGVRRPTRKKRRVRRRRPRHGEWRHGAVRSWQPSVYGPKCGLRRLASALH